MAAQRRDLWCVPASKSLYENLLCTPPPAKEKRHQYVSYVQYLSQWRGSGLWISEWVEVDPGKRRKNIQFRLLKVIAAIVFEMLQIS